MKERILKLFENNTLNVVKFVIPFLILGILNASISIVLSTMLLYLFDFSIEGEFALVYRTIIISSAFIISVGIIVPIFSYISRKSIAKLVGGLRKKTFSNIQDLPISYINKNHSGDTISRLTNDISQIENFLKDYFLTFVMLIMMGISAMIYMFILEIRMAIIFLMFFAIIFKLNKKSGKKMKSISDQVQSNISKFTVNLTDIFQGFEIVKSYNLENKVKEDINQISDEVYEKAYQRGKEQAKLTVLNNMTFTSNFFLMIIIGGIFVYLEYTSIGTVIAFTNLQGMLNSSLNYLAPFNRALQSTNACIDRVLEIIEEDKEKSIINNNDTPLDNKNYIEFNNVQFKYEKDTKKSIISNMNFKIKEGQNIALVGDSGGGKSTVLKLILGFYEIDAGDIVVGGKSMSEYKIDEIRNDIAYVSQSPYLFTGTIKENISYGNESASDEEIIKSAKKANAHEFIMNLENGYDTIIGENGLGLSGGQKQRISISRAILKNSPILLLDEATSALDTESERLIKESLKDIMKDKTSITIAHRLSTIEDSDEILFIKDGKVVERGEHNKLLIKDSYYKKLYESQFKKVLI